MGNRFINEHGPILRTVLEISPLSNITEKMKEYMMFPNYRVEISHELTGKYSYEYYKDAHVRVYEPNKGKLVKEFDIKPGVLANMIKNNVCDTYNLGSTLLN